jgi:putative endonuclease
MAWLYLLQGTSGRYYLGSTDNLDRRFCEHQEGKTYSTRRLGFPLVLVASRSFPTLQEARSEERRLKKWKNPGRILAYFQR